MKALSLTCRRLEAQRRKERQEAHLYMTVDVGLLPNLFQI